MNDEFLNFEEPSENVEELESEKFIIDNLKKLSWAMRKISALKDERNNIIETAKYETDRVIKWRDKECEPLNNSIAYFESLIIQYHKACEANGMKKKTISTPYGKISARTVSPTMKQGKNSDELLKYADETQVKMVLDWPAFKKSIALQKDDNGQVYAVHTGTGERVEGIDITPAHTSYKVVTE